MSEHVIDKFAFSIEEMAMLTTLSAPKIRKDIREGKLKSLKKGTPATHSQRRSDPLYQRG